MLNLQGEITESSISNVGFVRDGVILTPPMGAGILGGITRAILLGEVAPAAGFVVQETTLRPSDLPGMEEAFVLSTTKDVLPVHAIDDVVFRVEPEGVVGRLHAAMEAYGQRAAAANPELRV
jgi:branched-chain amino acid aminotransferase